MKRLLLALMLLVSSNAYADTAILQSADGAAISASNPLQVTVVGGGGGVAGSDTQVQFNDGGAMAGDAGLTYNKTTDLLTTGALAVTGVSGSAKVSSANGFDFDPANATYVSSMLGITSTSVTVGGSGYSAFPGGVDVTNSAELRTGGNRVNYNLSVYAAGTVYSLTNSQAAVDFGTTDPSLTLDKAGTYELSGGVQLKYAAATFAANQTATCKLRRTNNTAADLTAATRTVDLRIITTITDSAGYLQIPKVFYTTSNTDDAVAIYCALSAATGAGTVDAVSAEITAVRLY